MSIMNDKLPASFRVFGSGDDVRPVIESLKRSLPAGVDAEMPEEGKFPEPTEYDKMVIFLMSDHINDTCNACHAFYEADVLSLIIATPDMEFVDGACDCSTEAEICEMETMVKALISPLMNQGPVNFDFHDLHVLLSGSGYFRLWTAEGCGDKPLKTALEKINGEISSYYKLECERMAVLIGRNPASDLKLCMQEIETVQDMMKGFSDGVERKWGMYDEPSAEEGCVRATVIISGKQIMWDE